MTMSEKDIKILWGRAAGRCSCPTCRMELTCFLDPVNPYHLGEMAHIIAQGKSGPRSNGSSSDNAYTNLILLCPTHHRQVDKAPEQFPVELLQQWKQEHENWIDLSLSQYKCNDINELKSMVCSLLLENRLIWSEFGPESEIAKRNPGSNIYEFWYLRRLDTIIPNNKKIVNLISQNQELLSPAQLREFLRFKTHSIAFEQNAIDRLEDYPRFPMSFPSEFGCE
jgi:hypothetical protein